jgi:hypothetical protein
MVSKDYIDSVYKKAQLTLNVCFRVLVWAIRMVSHTICILNMKVRLYRIEGKCLAWICEFFMGHTQSVLVDGVRSHSARRTDGDAVLYGVAQGTVMGPLLFLLFVNDLLLILVPSTTCRLFADDCLIYHSLNSMDDKVILDGDLDSLLVLR